MTVQDALAQARRTLRLTQREVALRAGMSQPSIAALEAGSGNPTLDTVSRWAEAVEMDLAIVPRRGNAITEAREGLEGATGTVAFRIALDLLDRLRELDLPELLLAGGPCPATTGSRRYDALLAAVVDLVCHERAVPTPSWCEGRVTDATWWVSPLPSARRHALVTCPAPFRARGIMIDETDVVRA